MTDNGNTHPLTRVTLGFMVAVVIVLTGEWISAMLVLLWAWATNTPLRRLGFIRGQHVALVSAGAVVAGVALKLVMKALVMPLFGFGPTNDVYHYLAGNTAALPAILFTVIVAAGIGEELVWRGFLFDRSRAMFGDAQHTRVATLIVTSVLFGLAHYLEQGWGGAVQGTFTGLIFGAAYLSMGRIWPVMIAHAAFDVAAVLIIYWKLEQPIAGVILH
jgi:membrane protease YdiL (CAAX protease family)